MAVALPATAEDAPRVPPELEELAGLARALPPEFAADILMDVAQRLDSKHKVKQRAMLEDAFALADRASEPMRLQMAGLARPGSAEAIRQSALAKGLDRLSLQARAVRLLHAIDPKLGNEYFERLAAPPGAPLTCSDRMVWDSSAYWETAAALKRTDVRSVVSPLEIGPAVKMLLSRANTAQATRFLEDVERLAGDDRAFTVTLQTAPRDLETLAIERAKAGGDPAPVLQSLARYLTRHLTGARCADTLEQSRTAAKSFVWYYNDRLRAAGYLSKAELPAIRDEDTEPSSVVPAEPAPAEPDWLKEYRELQSASPEAIANSKLFDSQPLVWWLVAEKLSRAADGAHSSNPVIAAYARSRKGAKHASHQP